MRRAILLFLIVLNVVSAITVEMPTDTPIKNISRNTITTSDSAAQIYPNYSLHYYILKLPSANLNVQINTANFEKILTRGNITEPKLYPITSENTYLKIIGPDENGTNITENYTIYTGGTATNNLNTAVARSYIVEFKTEAWVSGHYNLTVGALKFDPDIAACGTLNADSVNTVTANLFSSTGACLTIGGDNITLNLNGFKVVTSGAANYPIDDSSRRNITIANGTISGYYGIYIHGDILHQDTLYNLNISAILSALFITSGRNYTIILINGSSNTSGLGAGIGANSHVINSSFTSNISYGIKIDTLESESNITVENTIIKSNLSYAARIIDSKNIFINNTFISVNNVLLQMESTSYNNTFYWNTFTDTLSLYVNDTNGSNYYNYTINGQNEGNIYFNMNSSNLTGSYWSTGIPDYKVATGGTSYPYNNSTSGDKFNCSFVGCADYAPLFYFPTIKYPTFENSTVNSGTIYWNLPQNAQYNDSTYTTATFTRYYANTTYLNGTNWNFTIASGSTINGITATICRYASNASSMSDVEVKLIKNQVIQSENKAFGYTWNTTKECVQYGSISDKWGTAWTPDDWNNNSSGIVIAVTNKNTTNDTLLKNTTMLFSPFSSAITENFTTGGTVGFVQSADFGGTAKKESNTAEGWLLSNSINTSYCTKIYTVFQTENDDLDLAGDSRFYWINSSGANVLMSDIASFPHDTWYKINNSSTSSTYFYDGFRVNFSSAGIANTETWWIDNVSIVCEGINGVNSTIAYIDFVNITVNYTVSAAPTMLSVNIFNASNGTTYHNNSEFSCHANASSTDSYVSYNVTWFLNGSVNSTYTYVFNQGVRINVSNQQAANARTNDRWQCEVLANDSLGVSSRMNSTEITITTSEVAANTCSPPALATSDYVINMKDCCNFTMGFTVAKLIFNGTKSSNCNWGAIFNPTINPPFIINYTSMTWANVTGSAFSGSGAPIWINTTTWWVRR